MAGVWCFTLFLLLWFAALSPAAESRLVQVPQSHRPAGVFLLIEGGSYTFNFTSAKDACQFLNVTIATREQMQQALNQGLETCKFGWTAEQVAVIPRLTSDIKCGQGKTGLVPWRAIPGREFGVFCFNASDSQETAAPHTLTSSPPAPTPLTQTSVATTALITSSPSSATTASAAASPRPTSAEPTERTTASPPASTVLVQTICSTTTTSSSMKTSSTRGHTSPEYIRQPTESVSAASSTSVSELQLHGKSSRSPLGALSTTLIVLGVVLLLLAAAAGAVWYYGLNILTFWSPGQRKDDTETEMWKHVDSEMDLHGQHGAEEDDDEDDDDEYEDRKYSSDITLCVNPDMKTMCLE